MKKIILIFIALLFVSCTNQVKETNKNILKVEYDSVKAKSYGADEYGMKKYVMAFLKKGPIRDQDSTAAAELQKAHLQNITRMAEEGTLVLAGPFLDSENVRGIYIFDVETIDEAKALTETDPAIKAGRLEMELRPWYGTAALKEVTQLTKTLSKKNIGSN